MKRNGILNAELSRVIATLGHTDTLLVCDAGFPIPREAQRVDLAIAEDLPRLETILELLSGEIIVEAVRYAEDVATHNAPLAATVARLFPGAAVSTVPHTEMLDTVGRQAKAIVRTGGFNPWGNIALTCGVDVPRWFDEPGVVVPDYYADRM